MSEAEAEDLQELIRDLQLDAENYRDLAADYLRAAERAERRAGRLAAYVYAEARYRGDEDALDAVGQLLDEDWAGTGQELVTAGRQLLGRGAPSW